MDWAKTRPLKILIAILLIASFLRLYNLHKVPVSLFIDEVDVGYHAYSILKTGKDYVGNPWPLHFQSQAEYRTPLYLYSVVPTVAMFGITSLGVRLPAAIFGIASVLVFYLLIKQILKDEKLSLISAAVLAFSPWHIQYSRAGFEVTQLLFLILLGFYTFFLAIEKKDNHKYLWISMLSFGLAPWSYSTGKLFVPMIVGVLGLIYFKDLVKIDFKHKRNAMIMILITALPMLYITIKGQSSQRFQYISVFTDPVIDTEVSFARNVDLIYDQNHGISGAISRRLFHNKYLFMGEKISANLLEIFSTDFLFTKGDINLRHSIQGIGQFYRIEFFAMIIGLITFFAFYKNTKIKIFLLSWFILGSVPAAITRDGGDHATRLILLLPAFIILISYGIYSISEKLIENKLLNKSLILIYSIGFIGSFMMYQHQYWIHNPWYSERWWHAGFQETVQSIKAIEVDYDTVVFTNASEPPWIFFAAFYEYPPVKWQSENPLKTEKYMGVAFDTVTYIDKFHFGQVSSMGVEALGEYIDDKTLYVAAAREIRPNLIREPDKTPGNLILVKAIPFPSGEPAFYIFKGAYDTVKKDPFTEIVQK